MRSRTRRTLDVRTAPEWRQWLAEHHATDSEIWLVFHKRRTGQPAIAYDDAVKEALCFGWIDSLVARLDDERYARKFTPRRADSRWSTANRRRYAQLLAEGRLMPAGAARAPTARTYDAWRASGLKTPGYIVKALKAHPAAWKHFEALAPSYRRMYIGWVDSAKREETKARRLREAIGKLAAGRKPGLK